MSPRSSFLKQSARFVAFVALGALIGAVGAPYLKSALGGAHIAELGREIGPAFPFLVVAAILFLGWIVGAAHVLAGLLVGSRRAQRCPAYRCGPPIRVRGWRSWRAWIQRLCSSTN